MAQKMKITSAAIPDVPDLCLLLDMLFTQEAEFCPNHEVQERGLAAIISNPSIGQIFVARQHGRIVGMVNLLYTVSTALGSRVALLEDMVVAPDARDSGIGSALLEHAIEVAKIHGCKRITLLTDSENKSAQRFYGRHGFKISPMLPLRISLGGE